MNTLVYVHIKIKYIIIRAVIYNVTSSTPTTLFFHGDLEFVEIKKQLRITNKLSVTAKTKNFFSHIKKKRRIQYLRKCRFDKLKIGVRTRAAGPKGQNLCPSDTASKIIINMSLEA